MIEKTETRAEGPKICQGITYELVPYAEAQPGDLTVTFGPGPGDRELAVIEEIGPGECWVSGMHIEGFSIKYEGRDIRSTAGSQARFARVISTDNIDNNTEGR